LLRAWSWLHTKYEQTATKRLRVVETVSLGEKRFVALVSVEGRQFLIGGGAASVSILAQLGETSDPAISLQTESLVQGASE
jgi:flagellar biogenesis protein FliO